LEKNKQDSEEKCTAADVLAAVHFVDYHHTSFY